MKSFYFTLQVERIAISCHPLFQILPYKKLRIGESSIVDQPFSLIDSNSGNHMFSQINLNLN